MFIYSSANMGYKITLTIVLSIEFVLLIVLVLLLYFSKEFVLRDTLKRRSIAIFTILLYLGFFAYHLLLRAVHLNYYERTANNQNFLLQQESVLRTKIDAWQDNLIQVANTSISAIQDSQNGQKSKLQNIREIILSNKNYLLKLETVNSSYDILQQSNLAEMITNLQATLRELQAWTPKINANQWTNRMKDRILQYYEAYLRKQAYVTSLSDINGPYMQAYKIWYLFNLWQHITCLPVEPYGELGVLYYSEQQRIPGTIEYETIGRGADIHNTINQINNILCVHEHLVSQNQNLCQGQGFWTSDTVYPTFFNMKNCLLVGLSTYLNTNSLSATGDQSFCVITQENNTLTCVEYGNYLPKTLLLIRVINNQLLIQKFQHGSNGIWKIIEKKWSGSYDYITLIPIPGNNTIKISFILYNNEELRVQYITNLMQNNIVLWKRNIINNNSVMCYTINDITNAMAQFDNRIFSEIIVSNPKSFLADLITNNRTSFN